LPGRVGKALTLQIPQEPTALIDMVLNR
jgi:hypothetical protein